jgi:hypothetical protein
VSVCVCVCVCVCLCLCLCVCVCVCVFHSKFSPNTHLFLLPTTRLPFFGAIDLIENILFLVCLAFAAIWGVYRNYAYAWVGQDLLGIALLLTLQKSMRLPNMKVSSILLIMAFLYGTV